MAHNWKAIAKHTLITGGEVAAIGTSMILTKKFLDARIIFQKQIEADPKYADRFYIKHQGACKIIIGGAAAAMLKNPWLKMLAIGVALEGFVTEAKILTTNKEGVSFFESIGSGDQSAIDREMMEAAEQTNKTSGYGNRYESGVSGNYGNRYASAVSGGEGNIDLNNMQSAYVSGFR